MSRRGAKSKSIAGAADADAGYVLRSQQPLEILFFLLPLVLFYEIGLLSILRFEGMVLDNKAHDAIRRVFDAVGIDASAMSLPVLSLPGILLVVILLVWQALSRRRWQVDLRTVGLMALESALLAVPLVVLAQLVVQAFASGVPAASAAAAAAAPVSLAELPVLGRLAVSIGAGLYEELIFRMALIAVLHTLLVDLLRWKEGPAITVSVLLAAVAFAVYHPLRDATGAIDWPKAVAYLVIGAYFGAVFAFRGFGIVVGVHAAYDIAVLLMPRE